MVLFLKFLVAHFRDILPIIYLSFVHVHVFLKLVPHINHVTLYNPVKNNFEKLLRKYI